MSTAPQDIELVYDSELDTVVDEIFEASTSYTAERRKDYEVLRGDLAVEIHWEEGRVDNSIYLTALDDEFVYISVEISDDFGNANIEEYDYVRLDELESRLEEAENQVPELEKPVLE